VLSVISVAKNSFTYATLQSSWLACNHAKKPLGSVQDGTARTAFKAIVIWLETAIPTSEIFSTRLIPLDSIVVA